jgi:catechol 2,3-dioxygenase-like lactoylglutathione lyase family enzyme
MRLRYIGLGVVDAEHEVEFLRDEWQLDPAGEDRNGDTLLGVPEAIDPFVVRVRPAAHDRVDVFGFGLESASAVDDMFRMLADADTTVVAEPGSLDHAGSGYGFSFFDPDGHLLELAADTPAVEPRQAASGTGRPRQLSHYVINSPTPDALASWYCTRLGFRITDRLEDKLIFLTTTDAHHQVGIATADECGLNHIAFDCGDVDEFMRATGRLQRRGHRLLWGPGRHGPGDNTFAYFRDPAGFVQEFTTGLESVADPEWTVRTWASVPEQSDLWGTSNPRPASEFVGRRDPGLGIVPGGPGER